MSTADSRSQVNARRPAGRTGLRAARSGLPSRPTARRSPSSCSTCRPAWTGAPPTRTAPTGRTGQPPGHRHRRAARSRARPGERGLRGGGRAGGRQRRARRHHGARVRQRARRDRRPEHVEPGAQAQLHPVGRQDLHHACLEGGARRLRRGVRRPRPRRAARHGGPRAHRRRGRRLDGVRAGPGKGHRQAGLRGRDRRPAGRSTTPPCRPTRRARGRTRPRTSSARATSRWSRSTR